MDKRTAFTLVVAAAAFCLIVIIAVQLFPLIKAIAANAGNESYMVEYIDSYGLIGIPILMGLQALQIIVAVIPSVVIQILTGLCYGAFLGTLINLAGCVLGNILVFTARRQLKTVLAPFFKHDKREKDNFITKLLSKVKKPELGAFLFFLIPGVPNGIIPYIFAETGISPGKYLAAVIAGSIPSTFLCTYLGDSVSKGDYAVSLIVLAIVAAAVTLAYYARNKIIS